MRITSEITLKGVEEKDSHEDLIDRVVEKCFEIENLDENKVYVAITLTTPEEIREINKEFRKIDKETDVLSFPIFEKKDIDMLRKNGEIVDEDMPQDVLGDIIISMKKVEEHHPPVKEEEPKEDGPVIDIEAKPEITFEDFSKMQFQVGEIIACEEVKKSKKLLCSQVKIGSQVKQIVSGIKSSYSAQEMVGKKVMVLVNLKPAKLAGILSEGMILCAEDEQGKMSLVVPEKDMPAGSEIC